MTQAQKDAAKARWTKKNLPASDQNLQTPDKANLILDERIENAIYRVILVCGIILALIGLEVWLPMPRIDGLGILAIGLLTLALCMHRISRSAAVIRALER